MTETENYGFSKPELSDTANIEVLNQAFDQVDAAIKAEADAREAEIKALPIKSLAGETVSTENGTTVTAGDGATIVGDMTERTYDTSGNISSGNIASGHDSTVVGGDCNTAKGYLSVIVGGDNNIARRKGNIVIGGTENNAGLTGNPSPDSDKYAAVFGGCNNTSIGAYCAILSGIDNSASGMCTTVIGGKKNVASGNNSVVIGGGIDMLADGETGNNIASGNNSAVVGGTRNNTKSQLCGVFGGNGNTAGSVDTTSTSSVVLGGMNNTAISWYSAVLSGSNNTSSGQGSVVLGGIDNAVSNYYSAVIAGSNNIINGSYSVVAGRYNTALANQLKAGHYAKDGTAGTESGTTGDAFIIGNGTSDTRSNCFRVGYDGSVYGLSAFKTTGADYAEYFEWKDGNPNNEDRRGRLVALDGDKIRFATAEDTDILGVVSAVPCIEGDVHFDDWQGKYLTDVFGQRLTKTVHIPARYEEMETIDENGEKKTENILVEEEYDAVQWIISPEYDPTKEYISRETRKEWDPVGLIGKLVVVDDGTCMPNEYCKAGENGIATKTTYHTGFRVLSRIDETHIKVFVK